MIKTKVAFLEGRIFCSQSQQFVKFSHSSDWLEKKTAIQKSQFGFHHVNRLIMTRLQKTSQNKLHLSSESSELIAEHFIHNTLYRTTSLSASSSKYTVLSFTQNN